MKVQFTGNVTELLSKEASSPTSFCSTCAFKSLGGLSFDIILDKPHKIPHLLITKCRLNSWCSVQLISWEFLKTGTIFWVLDFSTVWKKCCFAANLRWQMLEKIHQFIVTTLPPWLMTTRQNFNPLKRSVKSLGFTRCCRISVLNSDGRKCNEFFGTDKRFFFQILFFMLDFSFDFHFRHFTLSNPWINSSSDQFENDLDS